MEDCYNNQPGKQRERGFRIRRATANDIPEIDDLLNQVNLVHHLGRPDLFKRARKYTDAELEELLQDDSRPVFVAADEKDRVTGYVFCVLEEQPRTTNQNPFTSVYIDDLCVDASARGQHIGERLFEYVKDYARKLGCYEITLNVWDGNDARIFYEKMGMRDKKTTMELVL